jgi:outer membrane biosynthesis protein TonB
MVGLRVLVLVVAAAGSTACFRAQARTTPEMPPLEVPPPPPRIVETIEVDDTPEPPVEVVADPETAPATRPRPAPVPPRTEAPRPEPPRIEGPPAEPPRPADEPARTTLQTTPADREGQVEASVRRLMTSATNDLNRVNYNRLNADAKGQYESAKGFLRQAEEALKGRNLVFAETVAEKAATLAAQLAGR